VNARRLVQTAVTAVAFAVLLAGVGVPDVSLAAPPGGGPEVTPEVHHDVSPPLRDLASGPTEAPGPKHEKPLRLLPNRGNALRQPDGALQPAAGPLVGTTNGLNFAGVGQGDYGFVDQYAPPDTNGAAGRTQYVQWVNTAYAVFDKSTGARLLGPIAANTIWSGFGGGCQTNNDGDPVVRYDQIADRWIMTQFSVSTTPYLQCIAVSTSSDATGAYNRYAFSYGNTQFPDYPKIAVWPDAYYISFNIFNNGVSWAGSKVCAYDRTSMLAGAAATQQCFQLSTAYGGLLPSDLDGSRLPPAGSPNYFLTYGSNSLLVWKFHVDWANPASTTLAGPTTVPVASFSPACNGGGACIPQPGSSTKLDSLADRPMYRLAYRNLGTAESLVVNHSIATTVGGAATVGVRWYELRLSGGTPVVYQQSTFAPDATYRWMGSVAMDQSGDIALGYSASSGSTYPSIRYTGRLVGDALNTMQAENSILTGGGSQTGSLTRWGDYSAMSVDPVDDCTFWYTNEYLKANGSFNWSTRIASFKFASCGSSSPTPPTVTQQPASPTVCQGATASFTSTASGNPAPTVQWQVSADNGATWSNISGATSTTYSFTPAAADTGKRYHAVFTNSAGTATSDAATLTVNTAPAVTTQPANQSVTAGQTATFSAAASGSPAPSVQWQVSANGGPWSNIAGATSTTYSFTAQTADNGKQYRAVFSNSCSTATSNAATLTVTGGVTLTISPTTVPNGQAGVAYNQTLTAGGGTAPYSFAVTSGALPGGLTLSSGGGISGAPNAVGAFSFTVTATDSGSGTGSQAYSIRVIYNWGGFKSPVNPAPALNAVRAGNTVPVPFSLNGKWGLGVLASGSPTSQQVNCSTLAVVSGTTPAVASGKLAYSSSTGNYTYSWKTNKGWKSTCRVFNLGLKDGTTQQAYFQF
jgi:hypothetical protein